MQFDVEFNSGAFYRAADTVELACLAEEMGFQAVWKGESNSTDPMVLLSAMAARTSTIKLGTAVYHIHGRSPVTLGIQAATLNDLSGGRVLIGLGVSNKTIASWHGDTFDRPVRRLREYADVLRGVARGERVEYDGEIYPTAPFKLSWRPSYPEVPVFFAGLGEQMTRLAGRAADGIMINMANPPTIREIVDRVRRSAAEANRDPAQLEYIAKVRVSLHADREVAKAKLRHSLAFYNIADHYRDMIARMGFAEESAHIREEYQRSGFRAAQGAVPESLVEQLPTIAATTAAEALERMEPYLETGITRVIIPYVPASDDVVAETRRFLEEWGKLW